MKFSTQFQTFLSAVLLLSLLGLGGCTPTLSDAEQETADKTRAELMAKQKTLNANVLAMRTNISKDQDLSFANGNLDQVKNALSTVDKRIVDLDKLSTQGKAKEIVDMATSLTADKSLETVVSESSKVSKALSALANGDSGYSNVIKEASDYIAQYRQLMTLSAELSKKHPARAKDFDALTAPLTSEVANYEKLIKDSGTKTSKKDKYDLLMSIQNLKNWQSNVKSVLNQFKNFELGYEVVVSSVDFGNANASLVGETWDCSDSDDSCESEKNDTLSIPSAKLGTMDDLIFANELSALEQVVAHDKEPTFSFIQGSSSQETKQFLDKVGLNYSKGVSRFSSISMDVNDDVAYSVTLTKVFTDGRTEVDEIKDIEYKEFLQYAQNLNMAISHKLVNQLMSEENTQPVPAGSSFVGNPQAGSFVNNVWVFNNPVYSNYFIDSFDSAYYGSYRTRDIAVPYRPVGYGITSTRWQSKYSSTPSGSKGVHSSTQLSKSVTLNRSASGYASRGKGPGGGGK
jgi:hypothetical protein